MVSDNDTVPSDTTAALILGAAVWPAGEPSPTLRRRAEHGAALFRGGVVTTLIACGGVGRHPPSEAEVIRRLCLDAGVPASAILLEDRSTRTRENIVFALPLLKTAGASRAVLVTDGYHLPRARLIARRLGLACAGSAPPLAGTPLRRRLPNILREFPAYLWEVIRPAPDP